MFTAAAFYLLLAASPSWLRSITVNLPFGKVANVNGTGLGKLGSLPDVINLPFHGLHAGSSAESQPVLKINYPSVRDQAAHARMRSDSSRMQSHRALASPLASTSKGFGVINLPFAGMKLPFGNMGRTGNKNSSPGIRDSSGSASSVGSADSFGVSSGEELTGNLNSMFRRGPDQSNLPLQNKLYLPMSVMNTPLNSFRLPLSKIMLPFSRLGLGSPDPATAFGNLAVQEQFARTQSKPATKPTLKQVLRQLSSRKDQKTSPVNRQSMAQPSPAFRQDPSPTFRQDPGPPSPSVPFNNFDLLNNVVADMNNALLPPLPFDFNDFGLPMSFLNTPFSFFNLPFAFSNLPFSSVGLPLSHVNNPLGALNLPLVELYQSLLALEENYADYEYEYGDNAEADARSRPDVPELRYEQPLNNGVATGDKKKHLAKMKKTNATFEQTFRSKLLKTVSPMLDKLKQFNRSEHNDTALSSEKVQEYLNSLFTSENLKKLNTSDPVELMKEYNQFAAVFRDFPSVPELGGLFGFPSSIFVTPLSLFTLPLGFLDNPFAFTNLPFSHFNLPFSHVGLPFSDFSLPLDQITLADESLEANLEKPVDAADLPPSLLEAIHPDDYLMSYLNLPLSEVNLPFAVFDMPFGLFDMPFAYLNLPLSQINTPLTNLHLPFEFASLPLSDLATPFQTQQHLLPDVALNV